MKYMLLIHQGTTPLPGSADWDSLSAEEPGAVYSDYKAINETPGSLPRMRRCNRPRPQRPCACRTARR